jgi:hypothetical protein
LERLVGQWLPRCMGTGQTPRKSCHKLNELDLAY